MFRCIVKFHFFLEYRLGTDFNYEKIACMLFNMIERKLACMLFKMIEIENLLILNVFAALSKFSFSSYRF